MPVATLGTEISFCLNIIERFFFFLILGMFLHIEELDLESGFYFSTYKQWLSTSCFICPVLLENHSYDFLSLIQVGFPLLRQGTYGFSSWPMLVMPLEVTFQISLTGTWPTKAWPRHCHILQYSKATLSLPLTCLYQSPEDFALGWPYHYRQSLRQPLWAKFHELGEAFQLSALSRLSRLDSIESLITCFPFFFSLL